MGFKCCEMWSSIIYIFFLPLSKLLETALKKIKGNNSEDLLRVVSLGILTFSKIKNLGTMVKIFLIQQSDEYWVKYS